MDTYVLRISDELLNRSLTFSHFLFYIYLNILHELLPLSFPRVEGKILSRRRNRICILGTPIAYYCGNLIPSIHPKTNPFHTPCLASLYQVYCSHPPLPFHFSSPRKKTSGET